MKQNNFEHQYIELLKTIINNGQDHEDRTGVGRKSIYGHQMKIDLNEFPILKTKKVSFHNIKTELLWFMGNHVNLEPYNKLNMTNIKYLVDNNVNIWSDWPYEDYVNKKNNKTYSEFKTLIKNNFNFAKKWGNLGPVYGKQWRNWNGIDQLKQTIFNIKNNPFSSRHIINSWNVSEIQNMKLPPCHNMFQFLVSPDEKLHCIFNMRSTDVFLGLPYNITSYALLTYMVSKEVNLEVGNLIYNGADVHIYKNHLTQVNKQINRYENEVIPNSLTTVKINNKSLFDLQINDINLEGYTSLSSIKAPIAV